MRPSIVGHPVHWNTEYVHAVGSTLAGLAGHIALAILARRKRGCRDTVLAPPQAFQGPLRAEPSLG